ncbi:ankyrin repeat-containing domain protein [Lophiotrema nucula]|uniref:Ankyrin repeat-containing domain protein n=1 Tax=Lophiotrema nucula TaxID=690887 RepID=A0A6A5YUC3_9PLEO|nr:ankyrin repeat-containing domain protein [Lophiotrema nucula]
MSFLTEAGNPPKASEADWDGHKETIKRLYCIEDRDLKGPYGVQEEMKRLHQFDADTYQYEKHFKRWKFRKNLKKEEWIPVKKKVLARKREGKESDIYLEGVLMPAKKVKRGIGRYRKADNEIDLFSHDYASVPQTPDGIIIATPNAMEVETNIFGNLPISHYFAALFCQANPQDLNTIGPFDTSMSFTTMPKVIRGSPRMLEKPSEDSEYPATGSWIPDLGTETEDAFLRELELIQILPEHTGDLRTLQFMIFFISNGYLNSADYHIHESIVKWLQQEDNGPLLRRLLTVAGPTAEAILETLYPYAVEGQQATIVKVFLDLGCDPNINLNNGRRPSWDDLNPTALGLACEERNLELVRVLLAAGADPNQLSDLFSADIEEIAQGCTEGQCPIVLCIWGHACRDSDTVLTEGDEDESILPFIHHLIQGGGQVQGGSVMRCLPLVEAVRWGHKSLIRVLLEEGADVNLCDDEGQLPLAVAIACYEFDSTAQTSQSLSIIGLLLDAGADINAPSKRLEYWGDFTNQFGAQGGILPFDIAASKGSPELMELLYSANARPSRFALPCAIVGGNVDIVRFTLEAGAIEAGIPTRDCALVRTINSEDEMFRLVFESGAGQQDCDTLSLAVQTAIKFEKYDIVPQLLDAGIRHPSFARRLQPAVRSAISSGRVEILDLQLRIGAKASSKVLVHAFRSKNELMIKKVLNMGILRPSNKMEDREDEDDENRASCDLCNMVNCSTATSPLTAAARFGNCEFVKCLLEQGASLTGPEPLTYAIRCKNLDMVATLLEAGSPINASACDGEYNYSYAAPLQEAVKTRQPSFVRTLLDAGANPNTSLVLSPLYDECRGNRPPLQLAVGLGDHEIAMMLLQAGADINNPHAQIWACSALTMAIRSKSQQMFDLVLAEGANTLDSTALLEAVTQKNVPLVKGLLTLSSRYDQRFRGSFGFEALRESVRQRSMELVKLLLSAGVDPNKQQQGMTALGIAITYHKEPAIDIVEALLQAGADPNGHIETAGYYGGTRTALVAAAKTGDVSLVILLIQYGADPNAYPKGAIWRSPLQAACEAGKLRVVQLLLNHNVDVNAPPAWYNGGTALQLAAINGHPGIVFALLDRGADLNAPAARVNGRTALEGAAENGRLDTVRALLDAGVGIHGPYEPQYNRALQFAQKNGYRPIQRELLARAEGVDYSSSNL